MADLKNFTRWDPSIIRALQVEGTRAELGAAYDLTVKALGTTTLRYRITELDVPRRMVIVAKTMWLTSVDEIRVTPGRNAGSRVVYDAKLTLNGPLAPLAEPVLQRLFSHLGSRAADGLQRELRGVTIEKTSRFALSPA